MLRIFYVESVVAGAILFAVACWVADADRLNKLIRKASAVLGVELDSLMAVSELTDILDAVKAARHLGRCLPPTPRHTGQTQEHFK